MFARTLDEHRRAVEALLAPLATALDARPELVNVQSAEAFDRVLVRPVTALVPVPTFDNSQMDGYAICAEDLAGASADRPVTLPIGVTTAAGDPPVTHLRGTASPVMTGAAIPVGADAVVPVEGTVSQEFPRLRRLGEGEPTGDVTFTALVDAGTFVRRRAEDLEVGDTVLRAGVRLTPSRIGAAAAVGVTEVEVCPRLRVLLCTTGDEVQGIGETLVSDVSDVSPGSSHAATLRPGEICDANTPMLHAALHGLGVEVEILRSGDNPEEFREALLARVNVCDLMITTGGISRGAYEVVRSALGPLGVEFGTVAIQPGGPQGLGVIFEELPGAKHGGPLGANHADRPGAMHGDPPGVTNEAITGVTDGVTAGVTAEVIPEASRRDPPAVTAKAIDGVTSGAMARDAKVESRGASEAVPILCFPGNPVSAILSFELFLAPTLRELSGLPAERPGVELPLAHDVESPGHKHQLRRGMIDADGNVVVFGPGSHLIGDLADADVLVHLPVATTHAGAGTPVHTWRFND